MSDTKNESKTDGKADDATTVQALIDEGHSPEEAAALLADVKGDAGEAGEAGKAEEVVPPPMIPVSPKPKKSHKKKPGPGKAGGPNVPPPPAGDGAPRMPFEGGSPEPARPDAGEPVPEAPRKAQPKKRRLDPAMVAGKIAGAVDKGVGFVAAARYKDGRTGLPLMMPAALAGQLQIPGFDPTSTGEIPIAALLKASPEEARELEASLLEVLNDIPIMLTGPQAVLLSIAMIYGARAVAAERIASVLHRSPNGNAGGVA